MLDGESMSMGITIKSLLVATAIVATFIWLFLAATPWVATILVLLGAFIFSSVSLVFAISGKGRRRAFALGTLPALFAIIVNMGTYVQDLPANAIMLTQFINSEPHWNDPLGGDYPRFDITYRQYHIMLSVSLLCGLMAAIAFRCIKDNGNPPSV